MSHILVLEEVELHPDLMAGRRPTDADVLLNGTACPIGHLVPWRVASLPERVDY